MPSVSIMGFKLTGLCSRRGMAAHMGRDVAKLKAKGGGKWKYMSEKDMLEHSAKYSPYRYDEEIRDEHCRTY